MVKILPANAGDAREDPLEKEMVICSSILAWKIPWAEEPGDSPVSWGHKELAITEHTYSITHNYLIKEESNLIYSLALNYQ